MSDNIKLSRGFRPIVLATLKASSGWDRYMSDKGWHGRSHKMTREEILAACLALGVNIGELLADYMANMSTLGAVDDSETEGVEGETMNKADEDPKAAASNANAGFEGRDVSELLGEILAPASIHMTPHLASMLPSLLTPLASAAVMGPRVETIVKTIVKNVSGDVETTAVNLVRSIAVGEAFAIRPRDKGANPFRKALENSVAMCDCEQVALDRDYVWTPELVAMLGVADASRLNVWLSGPAGVGKTEGMAQYAARLKRPFVRIAIDRTTEPVDLLGQMMPTKEGGVSWRDGKLTRAFRTPYCVVLIDEPTLLRSGTLAFVQTALDTRQLYLSNGEVVECAEGVFFVAADNTSGTGDETGRYVDTAPINVALLDRFAFRVNVDYLDAEREGEMLSKRSGLAIEAARFLCDYASLTRSNADSGKLTIGVTPRRLLAWAKAVKAGVSSAHAFKTTVILGCDPTDKETLLMLEAQNLKSAHATINALAQGLPLPSTGALPSPVGARFPDDVNETL